ncbi:MAG TPA: FtsX-like permease family protein [Gemmataceae bacterium]|nr:FtsX-like permease family protein [Gemmataceae bacterium]
MNHLPPPMVLVLLALLLVLLVGLLVGGKVPLRYNARNLAVRWPLTLLTGLAFTLVLALLTVMLAFVNGMSRLTEGTGHPDNVVVLAEGSPDESGSSLPLSDTRDIDHQAGIKRWQSDERSKPAPLCSRELYLVANTPVAPKAGTTAGAQRRGAVRKVDIDKSSLQMSDDQGAEHTVRLADAGKVFANNREGKLETLKPGDSLWLAYEERDKELVATEIRGSNKRRFVQIRGIEDPGIATQVHRLDLLPGSQWFSSAGVEELPTAGKKKAVATAVQAVLGQGLAREMGHDVGKASLEVGDVFELGPKKWKIVGIMNSEGQTFDSEIWAKRGYVGELFGKPNAISSIIIQAESPEAATALVKDLKDNYKKANLQPQTEPEYFAKLSGMTTQLRVGIIFLTFFMAVGGSLGVMNTMFAAISQRAKDIGVLRILGYARRQILVSFLLEALVIALVGGLLGCAIGSLSNGISATSIVGGQGGFGKTVIFRLAVDPSTLSIGIVLTLFMGLLGGLLPSLSAMRLRPLESMR